MTTYQEHACNNEVEKIKGENPMYATMKYFYVLGCINAAIWLVMPNQSSKEEDFVASMELDAPKLILPLTGHIIVHSVRCPWF